MAALFVCTSVLLHLHLLLLGHILDLPASERVVVDARDWHGPVLRVVVVALRLRQLALGLEVAADEEAVEQKGEHADKVEDEGPRGRPHDFLALLGVDRTFTPNQAVRRAITCRVAGFIEEIVQFVRFVVEFF